jgi:hypothetical protein
MIEVGSTVEATCDVPNMRKTRLAGVVTFVSPDLRWLQLDSAGTGTRLRVRMRDVVVADVDAKHARVKDHHERSRKQRNEVSE